MHVSVIVGMNCNAYVYVCASGLGRLEANGAESVSLGPSDFGEPP